jgi:hypothetical protein
MKHKRFDHPQTRAYFNLFGSGQPKIKHTLFDHPQTRAYFKKKLGGKLVDNPQVRVE